MLPLPMTAQDVVSTWLSTKSFPDVDTDTAAAAVALLLAKPTFFSQLTPTGKNGDQNFTRFRSLLNIAGLPDDHISQATWLALRSCRPVPGDGVRIDLACPVSKAMVTALGCVTSNTAIVIGDENAPADAIRIAPAGTSLTAPGVIATPAGTILFADVTLVQPNAPWSKLVQAASHSAALRGKPAYEQDPDATVELDWTAIDHRQTVDADAIYEDWHPEIARHAQLKRHPAPLIQSATLATVKPPKTDYRPRLPQRIIQSGLISDAQFEFLVAAGHAHSIHLPPSEDSRDQRPRRAGFFLADGTGAGKTNSLLGAVIDNRLHGRRRSIIVLGKKGHVHGFKAAWRSLGQRDDQILLGWEYNNCTALPDRDGLVFVSYNMLRVENANGNTPSASLEGLCAWAGDDFAGILAFDESQEMRNAAGDENHSGKASEISLQGMGGLLLQNQLPDARVIYASATGATDVHNLAYADRLGIWGHGTAFPERLHFIKTFEAGGISDLEQVTLSLKAQGVYMARSLSFEGVEIEHLPVTLTPDERRTYNEAADLWQEMYAAVATLRQMCGIADTNGNGKTISSAKLAHSNLNGLFESKRKSAMANLIASFKTRGVITDIRKQIAMGRHVVVQMQNTYEAQLDRALQGVTDYASIALEPAELIEFAKALPVAKHRRVMTTSPTGEKIWTYERIVDDEGNDVEEPAAVHLRNTLIAKARGIKFPLPPLDQIILTFGADRVAEVTGRSKRLVPDRAGGRDRGATGIRIEDNRKLNDRILDIEDFHADRKPILVFSTGAGGASYSYHARSDTPAGHRRRMHYLIQLGYRADEVTQGIGRTHRSDQESAPTVSLVSIDLPADQLYASRIVNAIFKLGALTQGHRHASSNGMFSENDCLDSVYAERAWEDLQDQINEGKIPNYSWEAFMRDLGLDIDGAAGPHMRNSTRERRVLTNVNQMINRVAALGDRKQKQIFDALRLQIDARIEMAIRDGTFNAGPEVLKASSLSIVSSHVIHTDPVFNSETTLYRLRKVTMRTFTQFKDAYRTYLRNRGSIDESRAYFATHRSTGAVALLCAAKPTITINGDKIPNIEVMMPTGSVIRPQRIVDREPWKRIADVGDTLEEIWNATIDASENENISYITVVAGATLPIWHKLSQASAYHHSIYRLKTDDGLTLSARPLSVRLAHGLLEELGLPVKPSDAEVDELIHEMSQDRSVRLGHPYGTTHVLSGMFSGPVIHGLSLKLFDAYRDVQLTQYLEHTLHAFKDPQKTNFWTYTGTLDEIRDALRGLLVISPAMFVQANTAAPKVSALVTP